MTTNTQPTVYEVVWWRRPLMFTALSVRGFVLRSLRAMHVRHDHAATNPVTGDFDAGDVPEQLRHFAPGEVLPWKGVSFKVGKVCGGEFPCIILVPTSITHGAKLRTMRRFRDLAKRRVS